MPEKKKQHFVPQFYLRNFSKDASEKCISIFNIARRKVIGSASLKDQCYEDYFYGKDLIAENMFSVIEGQASKVISGIIDRNEVPRKLSPEHDTLLMHVLMQHARTKHMADSTEQQVGEFAKIILSKKTSVSEYLNEVSIRLTEPTEIPISVAIKGRPLLDDLHFKILINATDVDFITSDNPVVRRNQFACGRKTFNNIGFACIGLQIFFPLSPKHIVIFYDSKIYKIGSKNSTECIIKNKSDVHRLNELQVLNADENLYFSDVGQKSNVFSAFFSSLSFHSKNRPILEEGPAQDQGNGRFGSMVRMHTPEQSKKLELSFVKLHRLISRDELDHVGPLVRNVDMVYAVQEFQRLVDRGIYRINEFNDYLASKRTDYRM
ncbi:DUF4238 domain-containing protein [Rugamonas sp.]|uniref:DUF4238 domain-containing protein n=1 Tax=Rugamonas sp. TaxID=1926287 RepID=UPI0025F9A647|nr:DUF4238 domain-containing protein [Rugamonas sp.]